ncbi:MAG: ribonuclease III domain-containing protein, partial [Smithellaceae bacterium]|nr:ribonuclease III domain-containing protein [Smithellaceae bacterium]
MNIAEHRWDDLRAVETSLAYRFKKPALLDQALTHRSFIHESPGEAAGDNERLEFLGDAVLDLGVSSILMKKFPDYQEGRLTKLRSSLVNDRSLARLAQRLDLGDHLRLGKGEEGTGGRKKNSVLA